MPRLLVAVLGVVVPVAFAVAVLDVADARRPEPLVAARAAPSAAPQPVALLAAWDARRAAAWAAGDADALGRLYTPASAAGRADVAMLRRWSGRGLRVTDLRMQVLAVDVRAASPGRWELDVTDRLAGGVAVGAGRRTTLPRDGWSTRRIVVQRVAGAWRVAAVSPVPPGAPR